MSRPHTQAKYDAIRKDYLKYTNKKYKGVRIYTDSYIFKKLSEKYYLSPATIENIVYSRIN